MKYISYLFEKLHEIFLVDLPLFVGHLETLAVITEDNQAICSKFSETDLLFFTKMIMNKGQKPEYLTIFEFLISTSYKYGIDKEIGNKIVKILFEKNFFSFLAVKIYIFCEKYFLFLDISFKYSLVF